MNVFMERWQENQEKSIDLVQEIVNLQLKMRSVQDSSLWDVEILEFHQISLMYQAKLFDQLHSKIMELKEKIMNKFRSIHEEMEVFCSKSKEQTVHHPYFIQNNNGNREEIKGMNSTMLEMNALKEEDTKPKSHDQILKEYSEELKNKEKLVSIFTSTLLIKDDCESREPSHSDHPDQKNTSFVSINSREEATYYLSSWIYEPYLSSS